MTPSKHHHPPGRSSDGHTTTLPRLPTTHHQRNPMPHLPHPNRHTTRSTTTSPPPLPRRLPATSSSRQSQRNTLLDLRARTSRRRPLAGRPPGASRPHLATPTRASQLQRRTRQPNMTPTRGATRPARGRGAGSTRRATGDRHPITNQVYASDRAVDRG
jgi:hypothetical protein